MDEIRNEIRDIVIETRSDVKHILTQIKKISEEITDHECRIRSIEISGSQKADEAIIGFRTLEGRVDELERNACSETSVTRAKDSWVDSTWAKVGIAAGIILGAWAWAKDFLKF